MDAWFSKFIFQLCSKHVKVCHLTTVLGLLGIDGVFYRYLSRFLEFCQYYRGLGADAFRDSLMRIWWFLRQDLSKSAYVLILHFTAVFGVLLLFSEKFQLFQMFQLQ